MRLATLSLLIAGALAAPARKHCSPIVSGKTLQVESAGHTYPVGFTKLLCQRDAPRLTLTDEHANKTFSLYACGERLVNDDTDYCVTISLGGNMYGSQDGSLSMQPCMDSGDVHERQRFALRDGHIAFAERSAVKLDDGAIALTAGEAKQVLKLA